MHGLRIWLSGSSSPIGYIDPDAQRPHYVHPDEARQRFQAYNHDKASPTASFAPLQVQMLGFASELERFTVCVVYCRLKWLQRPPLGAVVPPDGESKAGNGRFSVHKAEDGNTFESQLAGDGWAYCAPNRGHLGLR